MKSLLGKNVFLRIFVRKYDWRIILKSLSRAYCCSTCYAFVVHFSLKMSDTLAVTPFFFLLSLLERHKDQFKWKFHKMYALCTSILNKSLFTCFVCFYAILQMNGLRRMGRHLTFKPNKTQQQQFHNRARRRRRRNYTYIT